MLAIIAVPSNALHIPARILKPSIEWCTKPACAAICDCTLQRSHREVATHQRSIHSHPTTFARKAIEDYR